MLQEHLLRRLTNSSLLAIMRVDGRGHVREASAPALATLGYDRQDLQQGRISWDAIAPPAGVDMAQLARTHGMGHASDAELLFLHKDGTRVPVILEVTALDDAGDSYLVVFASGTETQAARRQESIELERHKVILKSTPVAVFAKEYRDHEPDIYILANPMASHILGVEQLVGCSDYDIFPQEIAAEIQANDRKVVANGEAVTVEEWAPDARTGEMLCFLSTKVPLHDATGRPYGIGGIALDITRQKHLTARLAALVDAIPDTLLRLDASGRCLDFKSSPNGFFAGTGAQLIGTNLAASPLPGDVTRLIMDATHRVLETGQTQELEHSLATRAGQRHWETRVVKSGSQEVVALIRDITEAKRTRAALQATNARLQAANDELAEFAYVASHDLQEPLRTVGSFVELLERRYPDAFDDKSRKWLQFIVSGTLRMRALIDDLLAYSRVGRVDRFELIDTRALVDAILGDMHAGIEASGAEIHVGDLPRVTANITELQQVFQNLISNALKFQHPDVTPRVSITAAPGARGWTFAITDNGIGIEPQYQDRIFLVFQRLHSRDEYPGTGIGLALVKKIVERQGGQITIRSTPGQGTEIRFTLPATATPEGA